MCTKDRIFTLGSIYYYRRRIPPFLYPAFPSKNFKVSLKTKSQMDAKRKRHYRGKPSTWNKPSSLPNNSASTTRPILVRPNFHLGI